jgi:hypothetical protein
LTSSNFIPTARFSVANPNIVWQAFDEESVVINLESGIYYSFNLAGALIWHLIEAGASPADAADRAVQSGAPEEARGQILEFCEKLLREGLIAPAPEGAEPKPASPETPLPWAAPSLASYTDMQDLFLLDPIHDVDEAGWPSRPTQTP